MKKDRYTSAGGVVIRGDQVLLLDRPARGEIRLPKGHIERGESPEVAALRETMEETGYFDLEIVADLGGRIVEFEVDDRHVIRREYYFLMALRGDRRVPQPLQDAAQFQPLWVSLAEAAALLTFSAEQDVIRRAQQLLDQTGG